MQLEDTIKFKFEKKYAELRPSEKKVSDYILVHLEMVREMSLAELAKESGVSQPTVLRCVRALGFGGYKEFQYAVVSENARTLPESDEIFAMYGYKLRQGDQVEAVPGKIIATTIDMLERTLKCISGADFKTVISYITEAERIELFGVENSMTITKDLSTKLLYLGLDCRNYEDYYMQRILAGNLTEKDVAIGVSYSGCSRDTVDVMRIAKKSGAKTIVITNFENSIISKYADVVLCTSHEQLLYGDAIFSRTSQLAIVDMIYMGVILSDYERFAACLDRSSRLIRDKAYE